MSFLARIQPYNIVLFSFFRHQIRTGYRYFYPFYTTQTVSLFFKDTSGASRIFGGSAKELINLTSRCYCKMSDTEDRKAELKKRLTPLQYHVTQEKGTER